VHISTAGGEYLRNPLYSVTKGVALWVVYCHLCNLEHDGSVFQDYPRRDI